MKRLAIIAALSLAGCAAKVPPVSFPVPPADRLVCADEPAIPPEPVTDEATADYMSALRKSWQGCREDVDWMRLWFKALNKAK